MGLSERGETGGSEEQGGAGGKEEPVEPKRWRAEMLSPAGREPRWSQSDVGPWQS